MPSLEQIEKLANQLEGFSSYKNLESQANARYILYGVKEDEANFPAFVSDLNFKTKNLAYLYLEIACTYYKHERFADAIHYYEKAGMLLEYNYANSNEDNDARDFELMVGSLAYYCACQYSKAFIIIKKGRYECTFNGMISCYLRKDYSALNKLIKESLLRDNEEPAFSDVYDIMLARSFAKLMSYFIFGEIEQLGQSEQIISDATRVALLGDDPAVWWEFRLIGVIISQLRISSLWANLKAHPMFKVDDNGWKEVFEYFKDVIEEKGIAMPDWDKQAHEKLEKYIRSQAFKPTPITELFVSQRLALEKVLGQNGAVVSLPTSSGKTRIAEIVILQSLMFDVNSKVLYIAPFRSLAYEMEETLAGIFNPLDYHVTHLYGGAQFTAIDRAEMENARVLIATPEKAKAILRANAEVVNNIRLVVMDEGHLLGANKRDIANEMFTEELRRIVRKNAGKFLVLSAVLPNAKDISQWLAGDENHVIKDTWRPSSQRIGLMNYYNNRIDIEWLGEFRCFNNSFVRTNGDKKTAIAEAAMKLSNLGSVLIYIPQNRWLLSQAKPMKKQLQNYPDVEWGDDLDWKRFELVCAETEKGKEFYEMAKKGLLCHGAQLEMDVRRYMERLLRKNKARFIYCTNTLAQGVNLGVSTVIVNGTFNGESFLSKRDFWNMAGRAGRSFIDTEGKVLLVCDRTKEDYKIKKQLKMYISDTTPDDAVSGIYSKLKRLCAISIEKGISFDYLIELINENDFAELNTQDDDWDGFFDLIDDSLLSLDLACRDNEEDEAQWCDDHFKNSLALIQAQNDEEREMMIQIVKARVKAVRSFTRGTAYPKAFASSGIPLKAAIYLEQRLNDVEVMADTYLNSNKNIEDVVAFFEKFDTLIRDINSKRIDIVEEDKLDPVRELWLGGKRMSSNQVGIGEKYYGFTVSWILNALAGRYAIEEKDNYQKFFEEMALLANNGLPSKWAVQIYLSGIHSRTVATEFAAKIDRPYLIETLSEVFDYMRHQADSVIESANFSELAKEWMKTLIVAPKVDKRTVVKVSNFYFNNNSESIPELLFCKKYKDGVYLCSDDMTYKNPVKDTDGMKFSEVADVPGIYFEKVEDNLWKMRNVNPYVEIDGELPY